VSVDSRASQPIDWGRCTIRLRHSGVQATDRYVVEADARAIEAVRQQPRVLFADHAADGIYFDDSGLVFELSGGGKRWVLVDRAPTTPR
jgi:hypothetical protein